MTRTRTTDARLIVQVGDDLVEVDADTGATFGRDADVVVGADDPPLHREVGAPRLAGPVTAADLPGMVRSERGHAVDRRLILANHVVENGLPGDVEPGTE